MTREQAIKWLKDMLKNFDLPQEQYQTALDMAIKALENIGHLPDRPCEVCEFHGEYGCCKWECVFSK